MVVIELIRIDFDNMENHTSKYETSLGMFTENKGIHSSPEGSLSIYLSKFPPVNIYLGWDGEIYPKFRTKTHAVNG